MFLMNNCLLFVCWYWTVSWNFFTVFEWTFTCDFLKYGWKICFGSKAQFFRYFANGKVRSFNIVFCHFDFFQIDVLCDRMTGFVFELPGKIIIGVTGYFWQWRKSDIFLDVQIDVVDNCLYCIWYASTVFFDVCTFLLRPFDDRLAVKILRIDCKTVSYVSLISCCFIVLFNIIWDGKDYQIKQHCFT